MLTHSSGIPSLGTALVAIGRTIIDLEPFIPLSNEDDFLLHVNGAEVLLLFPPGKKFFYCNAGYNLLGLIIEKVSGMKYDDFIKEKIFKPLKMKRSTLNEEELEKDNNVAAAYLCIEENKAKQTPQPFDFLIDAAGGIFSSVNELLTYLKMNMDGKAINGESIVSKESLEKMHTPYIEEPHSFYGKMGYGYGWMIYDDFFGYKLIGHGGSTLVSGAYICYVPEKKIGVVILADNGLAPLNVIGEAIIMGMLGKDPQKEHPFLPIQEKFNRLSGQYQSYKGLIKPKVVLKDGMLYVETEIPGILKRSQPLIPEDITGDNYKFYTYTMGIKRPVEFIVKPSGEIYLIIERDIFRKIMK